MKKLKEVDIINKGYNVIIQSDPHISGGKSLSLSITINSKGKPDCLYEICNGITLGKGSMRIGFSLNLKDAVKIYNDLV